MEEVLQNLYTYMTQYGLSVLAAVIIFVVGKWIARFLSNLVEKLMVKANVEATLASFCKNITYVVMFVFVIIAALGKIGVQTTSFIAVIGAAGLAVGLALQGSLANFAAGILIMFFKPFKVGDLVEVGGILGVVSEIHIFTTNLSAPDNKKIIVPNAQITGGIIKNYTAIEKRRVDLVFGISYDDSMKIAKEALESVVSQDSRVLTDPAPTIAVSELGDSSVNIVCRPWVKPEDYWGVYFDTLEKGKIALEEKGITIPFPQSDVHLYDEKK